MRRDLTLPIAPAPLPADFVLVPFTKAIANDCREAMRRAYNGELNDNAISFEGFWDWLTSNSEYDPDLVFVATARNDVAGFCMCWSKPYIKDLVVDEPWRRRGLGAALLTMAMNAFVARGAASVDLKTDVGNITAQSLYKRLGFTIVERID
jgi:ribosomal protein S18 acetylase RimI-like enzyme